MEKKVEGAQSRLRMAATAHPNQAIELHAGRAGGSGMEIVVEIDNRADLAASGSFGQDVARKSGTTRGTGPVDFSDAAASEAMGEEGKKSGQGKRSERRNIK